MKCSAEELYVLAYLIFDGYLPIGGIRKLLPHGIAPVWKWKSRVGMERAARRFLREQEGRNLPARLDQMLPVFARAEEWVLRRAGIPVVSYCVSQEGVVKLRFCPGDCCEWCRMETREACLTDLTEELEGLGIQKQPELVEAEIYFWERGKKKHWEIIGDGEDAARMLREWFAAFVEQHPIETGGIKHG